MAFRKKTIILAAIILIFAVTRISVLYTNIDSVYDREEIAIGTITHLFLNGDLPSYDIIQTEPHHSGFILNSILAIPFYLIFGHYLISLKLVAVLYGIIILILIFHFTEKYFNRFVSILSCLLFIFAPPVVFKLSLTVWGTFYESVLYTFLGVLILGRIFESDGKNIYYILMGFLSGIVLWLSYVNLIAVICWLLLWIVIQRESLFHRKSFLTLIFFITGLIPIIIDNLILSFQGLYIYDVPVYEYFFNYSFIEIIRGIISFFDGGLAGSFLFHKVGPPGWSLNYFYYLIAIVSTVFIILKFFPDFKSFFRSVFSSNKVSESDLKLIIIIYPIIYLFFYFLTSFESQYINNFKNNRYLFPLFPFIIIMISVFVSYLFSIRKVILKAISGIIIVILLSSGLYGYSSLIELDNYFRYKGYSYRKFSLYWENYKGQKDFKKQIGEKWSKIYYPYLYTGYGWNWGWSNPEGGADGWRFDISMSEFKSNVENLDPFYKGFCYSGLAYSLNYEYKGDSQELLAYTNRIPLNYQLFYLRSVIWNGESYYKNSNLWFRILNNYPEQYKKYGYEGLGKWIYFRYQNNPEKWKPFLRKSKKSYKKYLYKGIGWGIGDYYMEEPEKHKTFIKELNVEYIDKIYEGIGYRIAFVDYPQLNAAVHEKHIPARYREDFVTGYERAIDYRNSL